MSFLARLTFDGSSFYTVLEAQFEITQSMGRDNLPNKKPEIGLIHLTLESTSSLELYEWAIMPDLTKYGQVIFSSRDLSDSMKTLEFSNAFCVRYKEHYMSDGTTPMKVMITLSSHSIRLFGTPITNTWVGFENGQQNSSGSRNSNAHANNDADIPSFRP